MTNSHFRSEDGKEISKGHQAINKIMNCIEKEYAAGRITSISDEEMLKQKKQTRTFRNYRIMQSLS